MTGTINKKILIVDDNEEISEIVGIVLSEAGYDVHSHPTGQDLISKVLSVNPDLILMDIMLGEYDGRELCGVLKDNEATAEIPILLVSGAYDLHPKQNRANGFVSKPFDIDYLLFRVARTIN
jgi:DNA-binding response OmpR family regulator